MSITPKGMSIQEAYRLYREGNLIVNRKYQRKLVWSLDEKEKLVDSILRDYPIPLILFAENPGVHGFYEILDGVQRLTAIFDFIENRISYNGIYFNVLEHSRAKALSEKGVFKAIERTEDIKLLQPLECAKFLDYQLAVTVYPALKEKEMIEVFGRINSQGRQLSNQEKRQAGVINNFSELVRKISFEIRGDVSDEILKLYEMPAISIDDYRANMEYGIKADDIFWCKTGALNKSELKDSEDEEMIVDIIASILLKEPFARSKDEFDKVFNESSELYLKVNRELEVYGKDKLYEEIVKTFSVLKEVIESECPNTNGFRKLVSNQIRNSVKNSFYSLFMAFYELLVQKEMSPVEYSKIMKNIEGLHGKLITSAKYAKVADRLQNIDITRGLIERFFVKKEPTALKHGPGLALEFENSIRRSKIETARYEFKQGFLRLSEKRELDESLISRIIETIAGIANCGQGDGFIYIGIADKEKDAQRVNEIYGSKYIKKHGKYIVGIEREIKYKGWDFDQYLRMFMDRIRKSELAGPLKTQVLSQIDVVEYNGYSIIRILVPKQKKLTLVGKKVFVRNNNDTEEITDLEKILALSWMFSGN
ncbi:hypothetical protein C7M56_10505 [Clostridium botulinum]|uniref:DUF262 domain-containing protein n=1 Tax=Clostridium botulinum TaxID=1491 RepID=A0ABC8CWG5_CLOBO|nr:DUF262 domain-containing protein [Clostridium botulinum]AVQ39096.1 hypothetical protein C7M56_10505 [Clostridium botulinum]